MKLSNAEVGRRYGRALFEYALEQKQQQIIQNELQALSDIYDQVPNLGNVLTDAHLAVSDKQNILDILKKSASEMLQHFLQLVFEYRRMDILPEIIFAYNKLYDEYTGTYGALIISAVKLSSQQIEDLKGALAHRFQAQTINATTKVDPKIIGGIIVQVGDHVIDGSIATRIKNVNRMLLSD